MSDIFLIIAFQLIWVKILLTFYTHRALWDVGKIWLKLPKSEVNKSNTVSLLPFWFSIKPIWSGLSVWNKKDKYTSHFLLGVGCRNGKTSTLRFKTAGKVFKKYHSFNYKSSTVILLKTTPIEFCKQFTTKMVLERKKNK